MSRSPIGKPFLVSENDAGHPIAAKPLNALSLDTAINEAWLQEVLASNPDILPVGAIDERVEEPLVSLGREVRTPAGPIDNLFISRNGYLVVVETKLWRNPEARRKVVSQILDYAAHLRQWDYSKLESEWRKQDSEGQSLWDHVGPTEAADEADWVDQVNDNLSAGRMTLLIVGDGIRSQANQLAAAVDGHPDFQFRLGLVELRLCRTDEGQVLVIPTTMAVTQEIPRAIVTVRWTEGTVPAVQVETPSFQRQSRVGSVLTEIALLDAIGKSGDQGDRKMAVARRLLDLLRDAGFSTAWTRNGVTIRHQDPYTEERSLSLLRITRQGLFKCNLVVLRNQLSEAWKSEEAVGRVVLAHKELMKRFGAQQHSKVKGAKVKGADLAVLDGKESDLVAGLEDAVRLIQAEAERLPPVEESSG